jgi:formylglycine-generating enzyme required for sulfatase activity
VCGVSWEDAKAFCQWLTEKERKEKLFAVGCEYRLPTETEWNVGVGSTSKYPWGDEWPPPRGAGNYAGEEVQQAGMPSYWTGIPGYNDGYPRTSPVGSFAANQFGLFDMGGNLCQWCEDVFKPYSNELCRVLRGDGWESRHPSSLDSSKRNFYLSGARVDYRGFRCVLVVGSSSSR